tara:strand:+ start:2331 stop:2588 length:258 start_codon:yes stop_codon:yes gene_type:complete
MNLKNNTLEDAISKNIPVYLVYKEDTKEILEWWPFGEALAKSSAGMRNSMHGPESHNYATWDKYVLIRDNHNKHLKQLEEIERRL